MSPSLIWLPELPRIGISRSCSTLVNWPPTRTCTTSSGDWIVPALSTAFCEPSCASTALKSSPSWARRFCEISMKTFSSCTPNWSTLATSFTRSSCWRTSSASVLSSA
ncbi:hypothetical protein D9M68_637430 [compost metagenome]